MDFDPFSHDSFVDPYPIYRKLRDEQPVYHNEALGFYALSRFRDYVVDEERTERVQMSNVAGYALVPITHPPRSG